MSFDHLGGCGSRVLLYCGGMGMNFRWRISSLFFVSIAIWAALRAVLASSKEAFVSFVDYRGFVALLVLSFSRLVVVVDAFALFLLATILTAIPLSLTELSLRNYSVVTCTVFVLLSLHRSVITRGLVIFKGLSQSIASCEYDFRLGFLSQLTSSSCALAFLWPQHDCV